jgi:hypothetical protein
MSAALAVGITACGSSGSQTTAGAEGSPAATSTVGAPGGSGSATVVDGSTSTSPAVASQGKITGIAARLRRALAHTATAIGLLAGSKGSMTPARSKLGKAQREASAVATQAQKLSASNSGRAIIARVARRTAGAAAAVRGTEMNASARKAVSQVRLTLISLMADVSQLGVESNAQRSITRELSNLGRWLAAARAA